MPPSEDRRLGPRRTHTRRAVDCVQGTSTINLEEEAKRANDTQIGGDHYKHGGEEHWDRAWRLDYDCFQYIITKWVERWRNKDGIQDLRKARHAIDKYIEVAEHQEAENFPHNMVGLTLGDIHLKRPEYPDGPEGQAVAPPDHREVNSTYKFTYEGGTRDIDEWTCKLCSEHLWLQRGYQPESVHECPAEATRAYVDQDRG